VNSTRKTAIITGVLFIIATAASLVGNSFTAPILNAPDYLTGISANGNQIMLGALFSFIAAATSASIAISLYPILKRYNESLALGAVGFRIIEAVFYIVSIFCLVSLFVLSQEFVNIGGQSISYFQTLGSLLLAARDLSGFVLGAISFSIGALMYYYAFYQSKLIPRWLSGWGLIGAVLMILASVLTVVDGQPFSISGMLMLLAAPIAVQEMVLAVWLIVKGFNPSVIASEPHVGS
jgi:hypothetical protein